MSYSRELVTMVARRLRDHEDDPATTNQTVRFITHAIEECEDLTQEMCMQANYAQRALEVIDQSELAEQETFPARLRLGGKKGRVWHTRSTLYGNI